MAQTKRRQPQAAADNPDPESAAPEVETEDPPAKMDVRVSGTPEAVRKAAKKISEDPANGGPADPPPEPPENDPIAKLLVDGRNMVVVNRLLPRMWRMPNNQLRRSAGKIEKYPCPITVDEIEDDVFGRFGGKKFKCTIHPNTPVGEGTILAYFTIENPDTDEPWFENDPAADPALAIPNDRDPMLQPSDDPLVRAEQAAVKRLEDAERRRRIRELEKQAKDAENGDAKPDSAPAPAAPVKDESVEARLRAIEDEKKEKKWEDRFERLENIVLKIAEGSGKPQKDETSLLTTIIQSNDKRFDTMMTNFTTALTGGKKDSESEEKLLSRIKMYKDIFGENDSRTKKLEDLAYEMLLDRASGGGGAVEEEDTVKYAIKQMTPVLRDYLTSQIDKEEKTKGRTLTEEEKKKVIQEVAPKIAKDLEEEWKKKGYIIKVPAKGASPAAQPGAKPGAQPAAKPAAQPGQKVKTSEGTVETVTVKHADLTAKGKSGAPAAPAENAEPREVPTGEDLMPKFTDLPGIGKIEIPTPPDPKNPGNGYDRKKSVVFVLDSIRSEIKQRLPQDRPDDSYVVSDALESLDDEILDKIEGISTGDELEALLAPYDDGGQRLVEIKAAGQAEESVKKWINRLVLTIRDKWRDWKNGATTGR